MSRRRRRGPLLGGLAAAEALIEALAPVAWYKFDEGAGTTITDYGSVGADLTGAGSGGSWVTGGFDTEGTRYFTSGANFGVTGTDARTICAAVFPQTVAGRSFSCGWNGTGANGSSWRLRNATGTSNLRIEIIGEGFSETTLPDNDVGWHFVAGSMVAGGDALEDCDLYADGSTEACTGAVVTINTSENFGVNRDAANVHDCVYGYLLVFDYELTAQQIANVRSALTTIMAARGVTLP